MAGLREIPQPAEDRSGLSLSDLERETRQGASGRPLIGGSSTGKTRSLYEAVRDVAGDWWLLQPSDTGEIHQLLDEPDRPAVVWLDELTRFLDSTPDLNRQQLTRLTQAGHIVVGTLWFEDYTASMGSRAGRQLLESAELIDVPRHLDADEWSRAAKLATTDRSIRAAMAAPDDGLNQVLAAGPELLRRWEHAPPYARAAITAAADARRIGILTPLSRELLVEAMAARYMSEAGRVAPTDVWLREIASYAERGVNETSVAALSPVAGRRPGRWPGIAPPTTLRSTSTRAGARSVRPKAFGRR